MIKEEVYYDVRVKNKEGTKDYLIIMNVKSDLIDSYLSREQMNTLYKDMIVYKQVSIIN